VKIEDHARSAAAEATSRGCRIGRVGDHLGDPEGGSMTAGEAEQRAAFEQWLATKLEGCDEVRVPTSKAGSSTAP
jgi:hypothetical protein